MTGHPFNRPLVPFDDQMRMVVSNTAREQSVIALVDRHAKPQRNRLPRPPAGGYFSDRFASLRTAAL